MDKLILDGSSIDTYISTLKKKGVSEHEIQLRLSDVSKFMIWAYEHDHIEYQSYQQIKDHIANFTQDNPQDRSHHAAQSIHKAPASLQPRQTMRRVADRFINALASRFSLPQSILPRKTTPRVLTIGPTEPWPKQTAKPMPRPTSLPLRFSTSPSIIFGGAMTLLVLAVLGGSTFSRFFQKAQTSFAYPATPTFTTTRVLSFQGRLTDSLGNPIVASTNMKFRLYTASSGGTTLYDSGTCSIAPDSDGVHNVLIGQDCGSGIASSVFTENAQVWLGVTVGSDSEMTPRQQIANVPYALNAETLQGLPIGSNASNVAFINQGGDLLLSTTSPQIGSTYVSQDFLVSSAKAITIQSAGTGDVTLTATESGTIKFATGGSQHGIITNTGLVGFGTTGPDAKVDTLATSGEQLRLTYTDGSVYSGFTTNSSGDLTITTTGGDYAFSDGSNNLVQIVDKGVYAHVNLAGKTDTGDPATCAEGDIYYNDTDDTIKICHETNTWEALDGAVGSSPWTDSGTTSYLTDTTDEVVIGNSSPLSSAKFSIDGDADQIQMIVQGNGTQTSSLAVFEQSDGTDVLTLSNAGDLVWTGNTTIGNASGDTVTSNAAAWTYANDTTVALSGGVNGLNFDTNTLSIDATNDRIGIGTAAPDGKLHVSGASIGKALTILNETGDQDILVGSASGTTRFRVSNDGTIYGGYFLDLSNTAYGIDPAGTSNFGGYSTKITGGALLAYDSGTVGIGDQTPDAKLNIQATTEQLRLDYDDSNYVSFTVGSGGDLTIDSTGGDVILANADVINIGGSGSDVAYNAIGDSLAGAANVASDNDLYIEDDLEVDGTIFGSLEGAVDLNFTDGSVLFANSSGVISQDNTNFFWNDTSNRLGLGDTTPDAFLDVTGTTEQLRLSYETGDTNYTSFTTSSGGDLTVAPTGSDTNFTGNGDFSGGLNVASSNHFNIDSSGNIGIGTTASSTYGSRMQKTINPNTTPGYYTYYANVNYSGSVSSFQNSYGNYIGSTEATTYSGGGGTNHYLSIQSFTNNSTTWSGSAVLGNWSSLNANAAANSNYMTGFRADLNVGGSNSGTSGHDFTGFTTNATNYTTSTIATWRGYSGNIANSSTGTFTNSYQFIANSPTNASGTLTNVYGMYVADQSVGTNTNAYGLYIASQAGASGAAVGLYIADSEDYSIQLASTDGDAASGITFGTDTNLYRNSANQLHTDDSFDIDGNLITDGNTTLGNASGDTVTANADAWTFANDTTVALSGGVNGINFDSNTLSIDATNDRIGIGTAAPSAKIHSLATTEQLRLGYDVSNYISFTTSSGGDLTLDPTGGDIIADAHFSPNTDDTYDLGTDTKRWRDLYLGPDTLHIGTSTSDEGTISYTTSTNVMNIGGTGDLAIDMTGNDVTTPDRVTIGSSTAGAAKLTVTGAETGKALVILNETGDQAIISASKSGSLYFGVNHTGDITKGESHGVVALNDQASLAPNGSFEVNSDGIGLPDGWVDRVGTSTTTTTSNHGAQALLLDDNNDEVYSTCFPIAGGQSFDDFSSRTYRVSAWFRGIIGSAGSDLQAGLYSYTSKSNCESHTSATKHSTIGYGSMGTTYGALSGTATPASGQLWARAWAKNVDASGDDVYVDGFLVWPTTLTHGLDLAETYPAAASDNIKVAEIVSFGTEGKQNDADINNVVRSSQQYDPRAFGVVATQPGYVLDDGKATYSKVKVALKGRVPVLVTSENGAIEIGDPITASRIPGVGMKATKSGRIIGYAMSSWNSTDTTEIGHVTVFVNPETYISLAILTDVQKGIQNGFEFAKDVVVASITATSATIQTLVAQTLTAEKAVLTDADIERLNAKALKAQQIEAEKIQTDELETNTLATESLTSDTATISGTLIADTIDSANIRSMRERLEKLAQSRDTQSVNQDELRSQLDEIQSYVEDLTTSSENDQADVATYQDTASTLSLDPGTTESLVGSQAPLADLTNLTVTGTAQITQLAVADAFSAGNVFIKDNHVLSMTSTLRLSALESIELMNGGVVITADGSMRSKGEVIAEKGIRTPRIQAVEDGENVSVVLGARSSSSEQSELSIEQDGGTQVASINRDGAARFKELSLSSYKDATSSAVVLSPIDNYRQNQVYAPAILTGDSSSGNGILPAGENDIVLYNDRVTADSIINITATSSTQNNALYIKAVEACDSGNAVCRPYFRIGVDAEIDTDVTFNWIMIN